MAVLASELEETCLRHRPLSVLSSQVPGSGRRLTFLSPAPAAAVAVSFPRLPLVGGGGRGRHCPHPLLLMALEARLRLSLRAPHQGPGRCCPGPVAGAARAQGSAPRFPSAPPRRLDGHSGGRPVTAGRARGSRQEGREERASEPRCPAAGPQEGAVCFGT